MQKWCEIYSNTRRGSWKELLEKNLADEDKAREEFDQITTLCLSHGIVIDEIDWLVSATLSKSRSPNSFAVGHPKVNLGTELWRTESKEYHILLPKIDIPLIADESREGRYFGVPYPNEDKIERYRHKHYAIDQAIRNHVGWLRCHLQVDQIHGQESECIISVDQVVDKYQGPREILALIESLKQ